MESMKTSLYSVRFAREDGKRGPVEAESLIEATFWLKDYVHGI